MVKQKGKTGNKTLRKACYTAEKPFSRAEIDSCRVCPGTPKKFFFSFYLFFFTPFFVMCASNVCVCMWLCVVAPHSCGNCIWQSHGKLIFCQMREHLATYLYMPCVSLFFFWFFWPLFCLPLRIPIGLYSSCPIGTLCVVAEMPLACLTYLSPLFVLH